MFLFVIKQSVCYSPGAMFFTSFSLKIKSKINIQDLVIPPLKHFKQIFSNDRYCW